ncbi:hypothetical protein CYY_003246 [Polysphondylium violaceum]|uniref:BEACH domain-containing protein n=1 Tax=Polysphondylium violaceum TaxID=133409 RepID=A0A8J4V0C2_9MYCE|nr:hypothetical protein CYY_003246 [Polysphondylium violaceum]
MGQHLSKEDVKLEIEQYLRVCFLSMDQEDRQGSHIQSSFNLSTASAQKESVEAYLHYLSTSKETKPSIDDFIKSFSASIFLKREEEQDDQQQQPDTTSTADVNIKDEDHKDKDKDKDEKDKSSAEDTSDTPDKKEEQEEEEDPSERKKKKNIRYKKGSFEASCFDGDDISIQILKTHIGNSSTSDLNSSSNSTLPTAPAIQLPKLFERVLSQYHQQQFKPQPNEYLNSWEYFDELNCAPIFYDLNPLYNMLHSDQYCIQEKSLCIPSSTTSGDYVITQEFIKGVLKALSTYISPLPNSIHFNDTHIPASIDYTQNNVLRFHPNVLPILEVLKRNSKDTNSNSSNSNSNTEQQHNNTDDDDTFYIIYKKYQYSLDGLIRYSNQYLQKNLKTTNFILYQLVQLLSFLHDKEVVHGNLTPASIQLDNRMWVGVHGFTFPSSPLYHTPALSQSSLQDCAVQRWITGDLSNFDYLMILNKLAHRNIGDHMNHPVMPWIIDFTRNPLLPTTTTTTGTTGNNSTATDGWRDLSRTKYRLNKGDEQLDFQFHNVPEGTENPHHISDVLSELTYYSYLARRTPVPLLRRFVRTNYEPNEYPNSMERLYRWTPDECIPEFFTDASIFTSIHADMPDLLIPEWAASKEEFIQIHMKALESDQVSKQLHCWIDLTFGYLLSGEDAIKAKNMALMDTSVPRNSGIVQLFTKPHPKKILKSPHPMSASAAPLGGSNTSTPSSSLDPNSLQSNANTIALSNSSDHDFIIKFNDFGVDYYSNPISTNRSDSFGSNSSFSAANTNMPLSSIYHTPNSTTANPLSYSNPISSSPLNNNSSNVLNNININTNSGSNSTGTSNNSNTPYQPRVNPTISSNQTNANSNTSNSSGNTNTNSMKQRSSSSKKDDKPFSKYLPSIFQPTRSNSSGSSASAPIDQNINSLKDDSFSTSPSSVPMESMSSGGNQSANTPLSPPYGSSTKHQQPLIHSKSEESMIKKYGNGLFSSMGITKPSSSSPNVPTTNNNVGNNYDRHHHNEPTSPISPPSPISQSDNTMGKPVTSPHLMTAINNSPTTTADLPITQIMEPLPTDLEFGLLEYDLISGNQNHQPRSAASSYQHTGAPDAWDYSYVMAQNSSIFIDKLLNHENNSLFNQNFEKLYAIYQPLEYKYSSIEYPDILCWLSSKQAQKLDIMKSNDMFALGCIISELYQGFPLFTSQSLEQHFNSNRGSSGNNSNTYVPPDYVKNKPIQLYPITYNLPNPIREVVCRLIDPNPEDRITPKELLSSPIFPNYFKQMYHFLCHYHSLYTAEEKLVFTLANIGAVTSLPNEAMDLILPYILELFNHPNTMVSALIDLLDPLSQRLGPLLSQTYLLPCLINLYQRHEDHLLQCHLIQIPMIDMIVSRFGRDIYIHHILPFFLDSLKTNPRENPNHEMLTTGLIKISKILGIPLTIRYIMYPLLVALTKPHLQHLNEPLIAIASSLGESVIIKFYFPAIFILIQKHSSKATRSESIPCTLLSLLQELILLVKPGLVLRYLLKESTQLASLLLNPSNPALLLPLAETLLRISGRIGVNNTKDYILKYLQQFFSNYSDLYGYSGHNSYSLIDTSEASKQLRAIYSPEMTYFLYYKLARIIGFEIMRSEISDNSLIEHIMMIYIKENHIKSETPPSTIPPYVSDEGLYDDFEETLDHKISLTYKLDDYQDYDDLINDQSFSFQGNIISCYKEHNASIKSIAMSPSESIFASGSKDNLVKIWSLESTRSLATYNQHMHTVHSVKFISSLVASCDITSIQVWDPESKVKVNLFYEPNGSYTCFEPLTNKYIVASSSESTLNFYDLSLGIQTHEWALAYQTGSSIRCLSTSNDHHYTSSNASHSSYSNTTTIPTWVAAGSSSGMISILDTRTGTILEQWKTHDGPTIKLIGQGTRYLISCSEKSVIQWDLSNSPPSIKKMWKGFKDAITSMSLCQNDLIVSTGNKITSISLLDDTYSNSSNYNTFRVNEGIRLNVQKQTNIQSLSFFPLHHLLLAGTEDGHIYIS